MTQVDERDISPAVGINRVKAVSLALNLTGDSGPIDTMKFSENPDAPRKKGRERSKKDDRGSKQCFHAGSTRRSTQAPHRESYDAESCSFLQDAVI
jgi:hypothetical protein